MAWHRALLLFNLWLCQVVYHCSIYWLANKVDDSLKKVGLLSHSPQPER